ncbi:aminotransferase-like domain-containing protein [Methylococcus geothermalis]|uniref:Aminotransferase class I/II-fold pyridoxal phosphate-dependent enzyme n=1 Tax=Methylococcus geothermalis TaxID=2681310 RepID=A0A858Q4F4_9GAMM|nr:PLP-dependent aminotransferase family protein [Methylococcus geothermalis]QJD28705.1 aminotransferase class I/II-fold pyridoxal phosphate-dependent enzyme [Methylococcus geothermalis]
MTHRLSRRTERLTSSLIRDILQITQQPGVISFAGGLPAEELMPDLDFDACAADSRQYGPSEGEPRLRALIAQGLSGLGLRCQADQVLVTTGSQQGIDLVGKLFIDEGTPVLLESPTYLAALQCFRVYGAAFHGLPLQVEGIDPDALKAAIVRHRPAFVYLIPSFQNPSGCCYTDAARRAVAAVLDETGTPLVEDDPYRDLVYSPCDRTPVCAYLERAPWVYLGSFSKITAPGLRVGYLASSPALFPWIVRLKQSSDLHTSRIGQAWLTHFIASDDFEKHLAHMNGVYAERRNTMQFALVRHFSGLAEWSAPAGGLFFWLRLVEDVDTLAALKVALTHDVAFMPGEPFFPVADQRYPALRLNFSHATPEKIEQGIGLLSEVLSQCCETAFVTG